MKLIWKWALLALLTVQNSLLVVLISRYNRVHIGGVHPSLMVCWVELLKLMLCIILELITNGKIELKGESWQSVGWLAIPALLYAVQNNLCHVALKHLSPLVYQVLYQSKILTTAGFSVLMLKKRLSGRQWIALSLLTLGIVLVQLKGGKGSSSDGMMWVGAGALSVAAMSSGFAGVLFELQVKRNCHKRSLWLQSIFLCSFALPISLLLFLYQQSSPIGVLIVPRDWMAWGLIGLQAVSGLLVAVIIRYLDNILKTFATGASIILSALFSQKIAEAQFWLGTVIVLFSVYLYNASPVANLTKAHIAKKRIKRVESGR